jgi:hypothetical protein
VLLLELGVLSLEALELGDLTRGPRPRGVEQSPAQPTVLHILTPLRQHEGMNLKRRRDGLHLNPGLLT